MRFLFCVLVVACSLLGRSAAGAGDIDWKPLMTVAGRKRDADGSLMPLQSYDETIRRGMTFLLDDHPKWFKGPAESLIDERGVTQMPWVYYSNLQQNGAPFTGSVDRFVSYPAFHHALLIRTFIRYAKYAGDTRSLEQAVKLADWDIAHSTPADWPYARLPWSTFEAKKPGGFRDKTGLMPDKAAIMALAYLDLHEATGEKRFREAADAIAATLAARQRPDGTWPFRVDPQTEQVIEEYTSSVIYAVMLFERLDALSGQTTYRAARDKTWHWLVNGPIRTKEFRGFYEDIAASKDGRTNYDCLDTIRYLLAHRTPENGYLNMAKDLNAWVEKVFMDKIPAFEPAEGIREQLQCNVVMGIHSLNWAAMLLDLAKATGDEALRKRAIQTANYVTYYLQPDNRIVVGFEYRQWWYSCHVGVILYLLDFAKSAGDRPNVVLILIDDQGYGDIAALGNPVVKTPALDRLHGESVRLTDYHVDPTCSPTRAALLTGRYSTRTGVWHTINGRSLLAPTEYTLAELFRDNGYRTGIFGKWHLGANAPLRPRDQGFDTAVWSSGGAVDQGANWFGNDCFDDTFKVNDRWQALEGYHTDVWFQQARAFIEAGQEQADEKPFFVYLPTTAAHEPWNVAEKYSRPYREAGVPPEIANFYGIVTSIDENVGRLRAWLTDRGLADNTILIFTTDNGTGLGWSADTAKYPYFNAGMRGWKGAEYDGGHRVPLFIHWPAGGVAQGRDVDTLAAHIDLLPTLVELCGLPPIDPARLARGPLDGRSLAADIQERDGGSGPTGVRFVHSQRIADPVKWRACAVMTDRWRLVNGAELYDIEADPGQQTDLAATHPDVVRRLRADYEAWWASLEPVFAEHVRFDLGGVENPTTLMSHDWFMPDTKPSAWHHKHVRENALINGPFMVRVAQAGRYRITPLRWPEYLLGPGETWTGRIVIDCGGEVIEAEIPRGAGTAAGAVEVTLPAGPATLTTTLTRGDGATFGGYYVKVEHLDDGEAGRARTGGEKPGLAP